LPQIGTEGRHTVPKIDDLCEAATVKFLRQPLATVEPKQDRRPKSLTRIQTRRTSAELAPLNNARFHEPVALVRKGYPVLPLKDDNTPGIKKYQQLATRNESVIREWAPRFSNWGILCGRPLPGGGFLTVIDLDRHGSQFGDGFSTLAQREKTLGSLPE